MTSIRADRRIYGTADRSRAVEEGDPEAAFLLYAEGDEVSGEDAERFGIKLPKAAKAEGPVEDKAEAPDEDKAETPVRDKARR